MFAGACVAHTLYGVKGEPEFGLDVQKLAVAGAKWEENRAIIEFIQSGGDIRETPKAHPVRALASIMEEVGVEETAQGPVTVVGGSQAMVPRAERKKLLEILHETHLGEGAMVATARRIWWWPSMANNICQLYRNCQMGMLEGRSKQRQAPMMPDNLIRLGVFELVG